MKKAWKWTLAAIGIPLLCLGLLAVDTWFRARSSLAAHEQRLANDISEHRSRNKSIPLPPVPAASKEELEALPCPYESFLSDEESLGGLERGHAGQWELRFSRAPAVWRLWPTPELTLDQALTAMAVTLHTYREGGFSAHEAKVRYEEGILRALLRAIADYRLKPGDLRRIQERVDELLAARVPLREFVNGQHLLDRAEVLRVIPTQSDPTALIREPPGWKDLYSWRILIAKSLNQLEEEFLALREPAADDPFSDLNSNSSYAALGLRAGLGDRGFPRRRWLTTSSLSSDLRSVHSSERHCLHHWQLARLAAALQRFVGEEAREPRELTELVPKYLPAIPVSPYGGKPFVFADGVLKALRGTPQWRIPRAR